MKAAADATVTSLRPNSGQAGHIRVEHFGLRYPTMEGDVQAVSDVLTSGLALIGADAPREMR